MTVCIWQAKCPTSDEGFENNRSELLRSEDLNAWTRVKIQECYHEVKREDDQRKSTGQQILQKSTDFHEADHCAVLRRGVTLSYVCPHCHRLPLEDYVWWSQQGTATSRSSATGGALRAAASTTGGTRTECG